MLQPLDIVVSLKISVMCGQAVGYEELASELGIGLASAHRSVKRAQSAGLVSDSRQPSKHALLELLVHGVRYVYFVKPGELTRGVPTAHAAPPLSSIIVADGEVPVWPDPQGKTRGYSVKPLHASAPAAAQRDERLYELLALVDAIRIGRARERSIAQDELKKRLRT